MPIFLRIYQFIRSIIIIALFIIAFFGILPKLFGIVPYIVLSGSMEPTIPTGSMAYINSNIKSTDIHRGDIITYELANSTVTHRVAEETDNSVILKGDANAEKDFHPIPRSSIIGKYCFSIPYLGYFYSYLSHPYFSIVLTSLLGADLIISLINHLLISKKEEKT